MKTSLAATLVVALLFSVMAGICFVKLAGANPIGMTPAPHMPSITIERDGSITPSNVPITKNGNVYTLTGDITNYQLNIKRYDIILDGGGFELQEFQVGPPSEAYAPSTGVAINANGVTVKNLTICKHDFAMIVRGANNTVTKVNLDSSAKIKGNYNEIVGNVFRNAYLTVEGNWNTLKGNTMRYQGLALLGSSSFNTVTANTIAQCTCFAVTPSEGTNFLFLNNFINNTNFPMDSLPPQLSKNLNLAVLAQTHISPHKWEKIPDGWKAIYLDNTVFDNGTFGNYWSDYNGTDADHDGVGDTPYVIGGNLQDPYPLMAPVDVSSPVPRQEPSPTALVAASVTLTTIVGMGLLFYFKKHRN
jgi:hypothetical protein